MSTTSLVNNIYCRDNEYSICSVYKVNILFKNELLSQAMLIQNYYNEEYSNWNFNNLANIASGLNAFAMGPNCKALGNNSIALGYYNTTYGDESFTENAFNIANGNYSHAGGWMSTTNKKCSFAHGNEVKASNQCAVAFGQYNKEITGDTTDYGISGDVFVIGNGYTDINNNYTKGYSNAFRITYAGATYAKSSYHSSGADYAEYFEWSDNNVNNEDRVGYFVTFDYLNKIRKANEGDYVLGIVSGLPCVIGNADEDWLGRWEHDEFNRPLYEDVEVPIIEEKEVEVPILDEEDNPTGEFKLEIKPVPTGETHIVSRIKANPDYDPNQKYIERKDRPEWSAIGMVGVLSVRDDGTCRVNSFCKVTDGGIATAADSEFPIVDGKLIKTYYVIGRVTENIIQVVLK